MVGRTLRVASLVAVLVAGTVHVWAEPAAEAEAEGPVPERHDYTLAFKEVLSGQGLVWPRRIMAFGRYVAVRSGRTALIYDTVKREWASGKMMVVDMEMDDKGNLVILTPNRTVEVYALSGSRPIRISEKAWPRSLSLPTLTSDRGRGVWSEDLRFYSFIDGKASDRHLAVVDLKQQRRVARIPIPPGTREPRFWSLISEARYIAFGTWESAAVYAVGTGHVSFQLPPAEDRKSYPRKFAANPSGSFLLSHAGKYIDGGGAGLIECFDLRWQRKKWDLDLRSLNCRGFKGFGVSLLGNYTIVGTSSCLFFVDNDDGEIRGRIDVEGSVLAFHEAADGTVYVLSSEQMGLKPGEEGVPPILYAFKRTTEKGDVRMPDQDAQKPQTDPAHGAAVGFDIGEATYLGLKTKEPVVIFVLDISGSMIDREDPIRSQARECIDNLPQKMAVNVICVASGRFCRASSSPLPATDANKKKVSAFVGQMYAEGRSGQLQRALAEAITSIGRTPLRRGAIFLVTDDAKLLSKAFEQSITRLNSAKHARIFTIYTPSDKDLADQKAKGNVPMNVLKSISDDSGGQFLLLDDAKGKALNLWR